MQLRQTMKLLLVGPKSPPVGGTTVLFDQLCAYLEGQDGVDLTVINSSPHVVGRTPVAIARFLARIFAQIRHHDACVLHASCTSKMPMVMVAVRLASLLFGKPCGFRAFGGSFPVFWQARSAAGRWLLARSVLRADQVFLETRESVAFAKGLTTTRVDWFPNSRPVSLPVHSRWGAARRFVFISHVKPSKGVLVLLEAAKALKGDDVVIDVYGPLQDGLTEAVFQDSRVTYCGELAASAVSDTLRHYDVLLLPTFYPGEGYPGIILEAYAEAMPVITTDWRCIPEITNDDCAIVVPVQDAQALREAIEALVNDQVYVEELRLGAAKQAKAFSSDVWGEYFLTRMRALVSR
jgi:glycosyltransferase involved in cell wall biosynthesis